MKEDIKKILRIVTAVKIIATCATVAATVYSLIPKYDKIEGVTETGFLNAK